jgi:hypothetical protein
VIAIPTATGTVTPTTDPATLIAMQTQLAAQMTSTAGGGLLAAAANTTPASGPMPKTGFFDQIGLPGLIILTLALIVVIFLSRRLRNAPTK